MSAGAVPGDSDARGVAVAESTEVGAGPVAMEVRGVAETEGASSWEATSGLGGDACGCGGGCGACGGCDEADGRRLIVTGIGSTLINDEKREGC